MQRSVDSLDKLVDLQKASCAFLNDIAAALTVGIKSYQTNKAAFIKAQKEEENNRIKEEERLRKADEAKAKAAARKEKAAQTKREREAAKAAKQPNKVKKDKKGRGQENECKEGSARRKTQDLTEEEDPDLLVNGRKLTAQTAFVTKELSEFVAEVYESETGTRDLTLPQTAGGSNLEDKSSCAVIWRGKKGSSCWKKALQMSMPGCPALQTSELM